MQALTKRQSEYAQLVSDGANQSDAYRAAYNTSGMLAKTVWEDASRLRKHPKVVARIDQLQEEKEAVRRMQSIRLDEYIVQELLNISQNAKSCSARVRALELLGKHLGLFQPKAEVPEPERSPDAIRAAIMDRLERVLDDQEINYL